MNAVVYLCHTLDKCDICAKVYLCQSCDIFDKCDICAKVYLYHMRDKRDMYANVHLYHMCDKYDICAKVYLCQSVANIWIFKNICEYSFK